MPIEIRELLIKVKVEDSIEKKTFDEIELQTLKNVIVKECVEKVMINLSRLTDR